MQTIIDYHDQHVLRAVLTVYFPYIWAWMPLMLAAVLFMPLHRRSTKVILVGVGLWHAFCIVVWGMHVHAPVAAWVITAALCFRVGVALWNRVPHGWFSTGLMLRCMRFDPRCAYLLDLARVRRGIPPLRDGAQRRASLPPESRTDALGGRLPRWGIRAGELAIQLWNKLPSHWALPQEGIRLDQPHLWNVLSTERKRAREEFAETYAAATLSDYRSNTPAENLERDSRATILARRLVLMREAMAEFRAFQRPLPDGRRNAREKWNAYRELLRAWRLRRDYDWLWRDQETELGASRGEAPRAVENPEDVADARTDRPEGRDERGVEQRAGLEQEEEIFDSESQGTQQGRIEEDDEAVGLLSREPEEQTEGHAPEEEAPPVRNLSSDAGPKWKRQRNRDIIGACRCLESLLEIEPPGSLAMAYETVHPHLEEPRRWSMAFHLLACYCKRMDWSTREEERLKRKMIEELGDDLNTQRGLARRGAGKILPKNLLGARLVYVETLVFLGDFARVRSMFSLDRDLTTFERRIMARACVGLSEQIMEYEELRDMLRYEALDHLFLADYSEVWRRKTAEGLVGKVRSQQQLIDLLDEVPLEFVQETTSNGSASAE